MISNKLIINNNGNNDGNVINNGYNFGPNVIIA